MMTWCSDHWEMIVDGCYIQPEQVSAVAERLKKRKRLPEMITVNRWGRPAVVVSSAGLLLAADQLDRLQEGGPTGPGSQ